MMKRFVKQTLKRKLLPIMGAVILLLSGCVNLTQPYQNINYYTLEYPPAALDNLARLPYTIQVEMFTINTTYDSNGILYRDGEYLRNSYVYHKWRDNPAEMLRGFMKRDLVASDLFKAVLPRNSPATADFKLLGHVEEIYEMDGDRWHAVLTMHFTLFDLRKEGITEKIAFQKIYSQKKPCDEKSPVALVEAMSLAMADVSRQVITDIHKQMELS